MHSSGADKNPSGKNPKGSVTVESFRGRLRLRFRFNGQRYSLGLGLSADNRANWRAAETRARQIENDMRSQLAHGGNYFDPTLAKYKPETVLSVTDLDIEPKPTPKLKELWDLYVDYKSPSASPKTINGTYQPVTSYLTKCLTDGLEDAVKFRMELLQITTQSQARRALMQLSACCKWAIQHGKIQTNPLEGIYQDLAPTTPPPPLAFTVEERDRIIAAFENDTRHGLNYRHYASLIKFLFWTGCRPCEAIGLRWSSITPDCSRIHFHESIVEVSGKLARRKETKTGTQRWFTCPPKLQNLLQSIRPANPEPDALVFPAPKGGAISETNFSDRAWSKILEKVGLASKDGIKMTPYNCRDTFITLQATQGNSSTTIARWVGNSSQVIEERYLDRIKLDHLRPSDV
ncbi:site-specific integrase [Pantanalinema rosaneae CENA516]|uniref:site-specific integrase n=1 Tax=Pantanalinema rosaneae TaxID=1620701 RepID=UPI003D6DD1B1